MSESTQASKKPRKSVAPPVVVRVPVPLAQWPDKTLLRIGELATLLGVEAHVVRFWTAQFSAVRPERSGTNRLLYGRVSAERLLRIRQLLYDQGMTIAGAKRALAAVEKPKPSEAPPGPSPLAARAIERLEGEVRGWQAREAAARASEAEARLHLHAAAALAQQETPVEIGPLLALAEEIAAYAEQIRAPRA